MPRAAKSRTQDGHDQAGPGPSSSSDSALKTRAGASARGRSGDGLGLIRAVLAWAEPRDEAEAWQRAA